MYTTIMQPPAPVSSCSADHQPNLHSLTAATAVNSSSMNGISVSEINGYLSPPSAMSTASCSSTSSSSSSSSPLLSLPESITNTVKSTLALLATSTPPASSSSSSSSSSSTSTSSNHNSSQLISNLSVGNLNETAEAAAAAINSDSVTSMFHPLRELQHYMAKTEEEKDKLRTDLITYSRFNCVLENIKRSFYKGFTALQCVDRNKSCRCNEHLNIHLRRVVQEADIELGVWQQQYDKLVFKYNAENGQNGQLANNGPQQNAENPLRHLNAALIGPNEILFPPDSPTSPGHPDYNGSVLNHSQLHNLSYYQHSLPQNNKVSNGKTPDSLSSKSSSHSSDVDQCHNNNNKIIHHHSPTTPNGTSRLSNKADASPERYENGLNYHPNSRSHHNHSHHHSHIHHQSQYQNGNPLKSSYNNMSAAINFSSSAFLKSDKPLKLLTNGHGTRSDEDEEEEEATPPPLIPAPINGMLHPESKLLAFRLLNGESGTANTTNGVQWNQNNLNGNCDASNKESSSLSPTNDRSASSHQSVNQHLVSVTNQPTTNDNSNDLTTTTTALKCLNLLKTAGHADEQRNMRSKESSMINNNFELIQTRTRSGEAHHYHHSNEQKSAKEVSESVNKLLAKDSASVRKNKDNNENKESVKDSKVNKTKVEEINKEQENCKILQNNKDSAEKLVKLEEKESAADNQIEGATRFECDWPECNQTFESEEILIHHRRCHIRKSNYLCKHCSARLLSREEMDQHVLNCTSSSGRKAKIALDLEAATAAENNSSPKSSDENSNNNNKTVEIDENEDSNSRQSLKRSRSEEMETKSGDEKENRKFSTNDNLDPHSSEEEIEVEEVPVYKYGRDHRSSLRSNNSSKLSSLLEGAKLSSEDERHRNADGNHFGSNINSADTAPTNGDSNSSRRSSGGSIDELSNYARYACSDLLLYPNKRPKSYSISNPSYLPPNHLAAFYPHLSQNGASHPLISPHHPMSPMDLTALMESGRLSPLTLSMLAQQHQQNQHRFQQYFAAAAAQHHLQQQQQQPASARQASSNQSSSSPPPSPGAENLTMPNSVRSGSFSSSTSASLSPFYQRSSSMSGLMGPPHSTVKQQHSSGRNILSSTLGSPQPSQERVSSSPSGPSSTVHNGLSHSQSQSHLFSPPVSTNGLLSHQSPSHLQRAYTISTPGSFSALAALAAAASSASSPTSHPSSASSNVSPAHPQLPSGLQFPLLSPQNHSSNPMNSFSSQLNGSPSNLLSGNPLHSSFGSASAGASLHQSKSSSFAPFDLHHRGSSNQHSPISLPSSNPTLPGSVSPSLNHHRSLHPFYSQSQPNGQPHQQVVGGGANLGSAASASHHHLLNSSNSQNQLAMIAAAAAAAADNARHPMGGPGHLGAGMGGNGSEATRLTAAALASLGALKHHTSPGPVGEYKRTRYSGIGRYRCPWPDCGYTPHFLRDLRRHMFKHTGDKKHKCDYPGCDFVSVWKTSLLQHQRKKHYGVSSSITLRSNNHGSSGSGNSNNNNGGGNSGGKDTGTNHHRHHMPSGASQNQNHHPSRAPLSGPPVHCNDSAVVAGAGI